MTVVDGPTRPILVAPPTEEVGDAPDLAPVISASAMLAAPILLVLGVLRRPALLLVPVFALLLVPAARSEDGSGTAVTLPDLALVMLAGVVLVAGLRDPESLLRLRSSVVLLLGGVLLSAAAATLTALDTSSSLVGLLRNTQLFVLGPVAVVLALRTTRDVRLLLSLFLGLGLVEGAVGTYQFLTGTGAGYAGESVRAVGTFGAYDIMAMATTLRYAIVVAAAVALTSRGRTRVAAAVLATALLAPLLFSLSRGALLSTGVAVLAVLVLSGWRRALVVIAAAGLVSTAALVVVGGGGPVVDRLGSIASSTSAPDQSVQDRYGLWSAARQMFLDRPVTGVGVKNFSELRDTYSPLDLSTGSDVSDGAGYRRVPLLSPHDLYYLVLAEQGLLGALAYGSLFAVLLVAGALRFRRTAVSDGQHRCVGLAAVGLLVSFLADSVYSDPGGATAVLVSVVLGLACWWASGARAVGKPATG